MTLAAGARLGSYEIVGPLGAGGMGEVYRARDAKLNRDVALKILPTEFAVDPDRLARFKREAQVLASLNHPNIAAIYGLEEADGVRALVLELVDGPTLADRIAQGPIPVDEALSIARQIAEALEAAHEQGIIHRDLKPANVKLRDDGTVKVLDFGLAKAIEPVSGVSANVTASPTITTPAMTQLGIILGTAAYMSPEQAKGRAADKRSDIWAFGCVLYEMLTASRAFEGEDVSDTLAAVLRAEPKWSALPSDVPLSVSRLLKRCLDKDPRRRVADISIGRFVIDEHEVAGDVGGRPSAGLEARSAWRRVWPLVATALLGATLAGTLTWRLKPTPAPSLPVTRFPFVLPAGQQLSNGGQAMVAISPDGSEVAYFANRQLFVWSMSEQAGRAIPGTEVPTGFFGNPVFSPDGRSIVFWSGGPTAGAIRRFAVNGGVPVVICQSSFPLGISWTGDEILFSEVRQDAAAIMHVSANGGNPAALVTLKKGEGAAGPQMLPEGNAVLFTLANGVQPPPASTPADVWDRAQIVVQSLRSGERKTILDGASDGRFVRTGHLVYANGGSLFASAFDATRRTITGGRVPVVAGVSRSGLGLYVGGFGLSHASISDSGSLVYIAGPASPSPGLHRALEFVDRSGTTEKLRLPPASYQTARVSPDGQRVAYDIDDGKEANVWLYDLSGATSPLRITYGGRNHFPVWSPDGHRLAFQSDREGDGAIFSQSVDGRGAAERLTRPEGGASHRPDSWGLKGDVLLFDESKASVNTLWALSLPEKRATPYSTVHSPMPTNAVFSPDGRWIAYATFKTYNDPNSGEIFVEPFPAADTKYELAERGGRPMWSPDGKELFYQNGGQIAGVTVVTAPVFRFGRPEPVPYGGLLAGSNVSPRNRDITPDGKRFIHVIDADPTPFAATRPEIQIVLNWTQELKQRIPIK